MGRADARRARQRGSRRGGTAGRSGIRRFFTWKKMLGTFFGICLLGMGAFLALYMSIEVPAAGNASATHQSNVYKYSNGAILARTGKGDGYNRENVALASIPEDVRWTFVAAENMSFYEDEGIDFKGTARGLLNTITGKGKQGGSTITQQYVKNYYLTPDQTISRKLKELVISLKVDDKYSKDEILLGYINTSYYGRGAAGIQAAAQAYYGKDVGKLTVEEGAYLAALLQAPSSYDVLTATPKSKALVIERWNYVLDNMVKMGQLKQADRAGMKFPHVIKRRPDPGMKGQTGYLVEAANQQLMARENIDEKELAAGGWTITLNIDPKRQKDLEKAVDRQLESKLDRKNKKMVDRNVQAGATSIDPKTGAVVALYGGADYLSHQISNATRTDYQPASTFKPIVFAAALENNSETADGEPITANTIYDGTSKRKVSGPSGYAPQNEDDRDYGDISVQEATDKSVNSVFAQMIVDVGEKLVKQTAIQMGMKDRGAFGPTPSMALGSMQANTMDMAAVYGTLAAHGKKITASVVQKAEHKDRETIKPKGFADGEGISRQSADTLTSVLEHVVEEGTGSAVNNGKYHAAGKTGTSENNHSAWFAGYTPDLATVVGLFGEKADGPGQTTLTGTMGKGRVNGSGFPAKIWEDYMTGALDGKDTEFDLEVKEGAEYRTPPPPPETTPPPTKTKDPEEPDHTQPPKDTAPPHTPPPTHPPADGGGQNAGQDGGQNAGQDGGQNEGQNGGTPGPDPDPGTDPGGDGGTIDGNANTGQDGGKPGGSQNGGNANGTQWP
ncbi:transglycosylase domain-containing protein [Streptomyces sp. NPDC048442]|uniref:transglycosylase domain-containing protein n=1 Tax=Streptomyces sp. NPDC048442 TaxID=3154823 RepID=UPI00342D822B